MVLENKQKKQLQNRLNKTIEKIINSPDLNNLSDEQLNKLAGSVLADKLKAELKNEVKKAEIDISKLIQNWLAGFDSKHTTRSFKKNISLFMAWLDGRSILDVNSKMVDDYILYLKKSKNILTAKKLSDNSVIQRISACSSFWKSLARWEVVDRNPWHGCKKPKKIIEVKKMESVPTNKELDTLQYFAWEGTNATGTGSKNKKLGSIKALLTLMILRDTGIRSGALRTLNLDRDGNFTAKSKGVKIKGKIDYEILDRIEVYGLNPQFPFANYKSFPKWFERSTKKLGLTFTIHGIRHRFAIDHYNKNKDIVALQRALGHSSIMATQAYLATLDV